MEVEVVRSARRKKTVQARVVDGVIRVSVPERMSKADEDLYVAQLVARLQRRRDAGVIDVAARASALAARYGLPKPASVRWVDNQGSRWGSCTPADGSLRISTRIAAFPSWVVDAVIVHELAHLAVPSHGPAFWALANRYPRMERARGFLIAKGLPDPDDAGQDT